MSVWTQEEHERFLEALSLYPKGPWREVARHVGSRSARQVQTHAQKYNEKIARRERGLLKVRKRVVRPEHRVEQPSSIKRTSSAKPSRASKSRNRSTSEASSCECSSLSPLPPSQTSESPSADDDDDSESRSPMAPVGAHLMESEIEQCLDMDHLAESHEFEVEVEWLESADSDDASDRLDAAAVDTLTDSLLDLLDVPFANTGDVMASATWQEELLADAKAAATEWDAGLLMTDATKWSGFDYEPDCDMECDAIMLSPLQGDEGAFYDFDVAMSFGTTS